MLRPAPAPLTSPDQESVWNYPRPPRVEAVTERLRVIFDGAVIAETVSGWRVLETSHACFVGDEQVTPQPGRFYGGWITRGIIGPFKGEPGSGGW